MSTWIAYVSCLIMFIAQCNAITDEELLEIFYPDDTETEFVTKCFGDLGCFYNGPPFHDPSHRRISVPPDDNTNAKFYLYTPDNPSVTYELVATAASLEKSRFNGNYPLKVLIHGGAQGNFSVFLRMKDELLKEENCNVILVDWREFDHQSLWQATANARVVAAIVAKLLNFLMRETCLEAQDIHIIAHSLGTHLAGWVGERINNLGRISGLDVSGVAMHGAPPSVRLDFTDAMFVDVLYTNAGLNASEGLSLGDPIGHVNFYPNGGQRQPGCPSDISKLTFGELLEACNHNRAVDLYIATINSSKCLYLATECSSWKKYKRGACRPHNSINNKMGFHAKRIPGIPHGLKFYLETGDKYPFCNSNEFVSRI